MHFALFFVSKRRSNNLVLRVLYAVVQSPALVKAVSPSGSLNEGQFLQFMTQMKSKVATQEEIVDALSVFDSSANKDGYVDTSSLKHAMLQMGS